jgi:hypothetical protein
LENTETVEFEQTQILPETSEGHGTEVPQQLTEESIVAKLDLRSASAVRNSTQSATSEKEPSISATIDFVVPFNTLSMPGSNVQCVLIMGRDEDGSLSAALTHTYFTEEAIEAGEAKLSSILQAVDAWNASPDNAMLEGTVVPG